MISVYLLLDLCAYVGIRGEGEGDEESVVQCNTLHIIDKNAVQK